MSSPLQSLRFWVLTLAALLTAVLTFSLGHWQWGRAAEKQALQAAIERKNTLPALDNRALLAVENSMDMLHQQAVLQGVWQEAHTVYLDNRPMGGKSGFWVVTPLALEGSRAWILVQRGWVPRDFNDRTRLPVISTPAGLVSVPGRMAPPPSKLYEFDSVPTGRIRQNLDLAAFSAEMSQPLLPLSLLQTGPASEGLLRDWPAPALGVDKHYGYAFQWFGLCALVVGLYVWFQLISPCRKKRHTSHPQPWTAIFNVQHPQPDPSLSPAGHAASGAQDQPLGLTVHAMPQLDAAAAARVPDTRAGRWKMLAVLLVCAAPVVASYFTYYVVRPEGRRNHGELIEPQRPLPPLAAVASDGSRIELPALKGQWLLVSVAGGACDSACQQHLYFQRQLRESLGREKDRLDRVWLINDAAPVPDALKPALLESTVLRVSGLEQWLQAAPGQRLQDHLYLVDPIGNWMMRFPANMDAAGAAKAKRDLERLMRASSSWDKEGR